MDTTYAGTVGYDSNTSPPLESRVTLSQIEAQLRKGLKSIEHQDIRKASEGDYGKLLVILEGNFKLYKQVVEQLGLGYSGVLEEAEGWFSAAYFSILLWIGDDKLHKSPIGEVFREYGKFVEPQQYASHLGIGVMVTTLPQPQNLS